MAAGYTVTYRFTIPSDRQNFYGYESRPWESQAQAEEYLQAVLARAIIKDVHIFDWQLWHGDKLISQY